MWLYLCTLAFNYEDLHRNPLKQIHKKIWLKSYHAIKKRHCIIWLTNILLVSGGDCEGRDCEFESR